MEATNPRQYDSPELDWRVGGAEDQSSRIFFRSELDVSLDADSLRDKRVLDIGSGVGQLFNWLKNKGTSEIVGIDPSERNIQTSKELYPWATTMQFTLSEFASTNPQPFDISIAVMVFEHIQDIKTAFRDISSLLTKSGEFYLIIGDKDFHISNDKEMRGPRFVSVEVLQELEDDAVETKTIRIDGGASGQSVMYDIFRPIERVRNAAEEAGFELIHERRLLGKYVSPPCHLLKFKKR
jgi:SAM-dependent methyltransferase